MKNKHSGGLDQPPYDIGCMVQTVNQARPVAMSAHIQTVTNSTKLSVTDRELLCEHPRAPDRHSETYRQKILDSESRLIE